MRWLWTLLAVVILSCDSDDGIATLPQATPTAANTGTATQVAPTATTAGTPAFNDRVGAFLANTCRQPQSETARRSSEGANRVIPDLASRMPRLSCG